MKIHKRWYLVFTVILVLPFSAVQAALPADVQADQFALAAKQSYRAGNYLEAEKSFAQLMRLNVEMPANVYFFYAKTLFENRKYTAAKQSVETYIEESGREGRHYRDALALLVELDKLPDYAEGPDYNTTVDWLVEAVNDNCDVHLRGGWKQTCDLSISRDTFSLSVRKEGPRENFCGSYRAQGKPGGNTAIDKYEYRVPLSDISGGMIWKTFEFRTFKETVELELCESCKAKYGCYRKSSEKVRKITLELPDYKAKEIEKAVDRIGKFNRDANSAK